jgi:chaperonin GroES
MIKPIRSQILIRPCESDNVSVGGIIIPDNAKKTSNKGVVVAIGSMVKHLKEGQEVFRVKDWGTEVEHDGGKFFLMNEDAILATN